MTMLSEPLADRGRIAAVAGARRVVVKVGSAVIAKGGTLDLTVVGRLADEVCAVRQLGKEVIMVVSGAVAGGYRALKIPKPPKAVVERQAAACIGQYKLMTTFSHAFAAHGVEVAQLLLMEEDIVSRRRFLSARHTLNMLLTRGIVPIINENDALADDECRIGDNDHLAALVTNLVSAPLMVVLSTADGVRRDGGAGEIIPEVGFGSDLDDHISTSLSASGVGGMKAKVAAARLASRWGVGTFVVSGQEPNAIGRILQGESLGTFFVPQSTRLNARRRWVAFRTRSLGTLVVDDGAKDAIVHRHASLLPSGVIEVQGQFAKGARVDLRDSAGHHFAIGLVSYAAPEIQRMRGRRDSEFEEVLGYKYTSYIVDDEDLVVL
jgi:glutamate 5-kinase